MNNKANRAFALVGIFMLVVLAWDLGHRQGLNYIAGIASEESISTADTSKPPAQVEKEKGKSLSAASSANGDFVSVKNQLAGYEVQVSTLELSETGWVGIRDKDGRVLGAGRFEAGEFKNVTVPLLRATVAGESYQALLYIDDGDKEFDVHKDVLISGPYSDVAGTNFKVQ